MILLDIKQYIRQHQQVSAENLRNRFDLTAEALDGLMAPLLQQGFVYRQSHTLDAELVCSSSCATGCGARSGGVYYWSARPLKPLSIKVAVQ